jgi:hypothetical protein
MTARNLFRIPRTGATSRATLDALCSEDELLVDVIVIAHLAGWYVAHFRPALTARGFRTAVAGDGAGFPDLVLVHPRHGVIFAELKTERGTISAEQLAWQHRLQVAGERAYIWRPHDLRDSVIIALDARGIR